MFFFFGGGGKSKSKVIFCCLRYVEGTGIGSPDICGDFEVRFRSYGSIGPWDFRVFHWVFLVFFWFKPVSIGFLSLIYCFFVGFLLC